MEDTLYGLAEATDAVKSTAEQANLVDQFQQVQEKQGTEPTDQTDTNTDNEAGLPPKTTDILQEEEKYDVDFGKFGQFLIKCGINMVLPFINGMMMGFGEIFAHEMCFRNNWRFARVSPAIRMVEAAQKRDIATRNSVLL